MRITRLGLLLLCWGYATVSAQDISVGQVRVSIRQSMGPHRGDILVLPGWNFRRTMWCDSTSFCDEATRAGYRLILPEMGKSVYATRYYPETRPDYRQRLTRTWVTDTLLPALQAQGLLLPDGNNYLLGLSTGARGVLLVAQATDTLFVAAAALSGDYDPSYDPNDALMVNTYGPLRRFPDRWRGQDSPIHNLAKLRVPLYLAHGADDAMVSVDHTHRLADSIRSQHPRLPLRVNLQLHAQHNWAFWGGQTKAILAWFGRYQRNKGSR